MKVKEVMTKDVISVRKDTPIFEALEILVKKRISGMPVVEDDMTLVGILSERDVLGLLFADKDEESKTVKDFMTRPVIQFSADESLAKVCACLMHNACRRVPVISEGRVVGVVSSADIVGYIAQERDGEAIPAGEAD